MIAEALAGGFADGSRQAAVAFRAVLEVLARPGLIAAVTGAQPPAPVSVAAGVVLLTLADGTTPVHLAGAHDVPLVRDWITFHTGAPLVSAADAVFALGSWEALAPLSQFAIGTAEYPDRSATLIVERPDLQAEGAILRGPGIRGSARLSVPEGAAFGQNSGLYPLGLDFIFTCGDRLAGLPRSTQVEAI